MATFKAGDRDWQIGITIGTIRNVKEKTGIAMTNFVKDGFSGLWEFLEDKLTFVSVLWVLCESQATAAGVSAEMFGEMMFGDAMESAELAFCDAYGFFLPSRDREGLGKIIQKSMELKAKAMAKANEQIDAATLESVERISKERSSNAQVRSASIPLHLPSASSS